MGTLGTYTITGLLPLSAALVLVFYPRFVFTAAAAFVFIAFVFVMMPMMLVLLVLRVPLFVLMSVLDFLWVLALLVVALLLFLFLFFGGIRRVTRFLLAFWFVFRRPALIRVVMFLAATFGFVILFKP